MGGTGLLVLGLGAVGAAIVIAVVTAGFARTERTGVAKSLAAIDDVYGRDAIQLPEAAQSREGQSLTLRLLGRLSSQLSPGGVNTSLSKRLEQAGNPQGWTPERILSLKGVGLFAGALLGVFFGRSSAGGMLLGAALLGAFAFYLPDILLYNTTLKRREEIARALPDSLDMLTVCVEAGLGFDAALAQVARNTTGALASECARLLQEMQIGVTRVDGLRAMADRTGVPDVQSFCAAMVQASDLGIPVADVLREQAKEMRMRRRQRAEELAQKVPVKILFPVICCIFPALFVIVLGPGVMTIVHAFSAKH